MGRIEKNAIGFVVRNCNQTGDLFKEFELENGDASVNVVLGVTSIKDAVKKLPKQAQGNYTHYMYSTVKNIFKQYNGTAILKNPVQGNKFHYQLQMSSKSAKKAFRDRTKW